MRNLNWIRRVAICALTAVWTQGSAVGILGATGWNDDQRILSRKIELPNIGRTCLANAAGIALSIAKVPGGIVLTRPCSEEQAKHTYSFPSPVSVHDVMEILTSSDPSYRWSIELGVVNVTPHSGSPAILDTHISLFDSESHTTLSAAADLLLRLPEVRKRAKELRFDEAFSSLQGYYAIKKSGATPQATDEPLHVRVKDVTLRGALNAIVRKHGHGVWIYEEYWNSGKHYFEISFVGH
jgi:hypothetical protein